MSAVLDLDRIHLLLSIKHSFLEQFIEFIHASEDGSSALNSGDPGNFRFIIFIVHFGCRADPEPVTFRSPSKQPES